jgi:hypothetical protein
LRQFRSEAVDLDLHAFCQISELHDNLISRVFAHETQSLRSVVLQTFCSFLSDAVSAVQLFIALPFKYVELWIQLQVQN